MVFNYFAMQKIIVLPLVFDWFSGGLQKRLLFQFKHFSHFRVSGPQRKYYHLVCKYFVKVFPRSRFQKCEMGILKMKWKNAMRIPNKLTKKIDPRLVCQTLRSRGRIRERWPEPPLAKRLSFKGMGVKKEHSFLLWSPRNSGPKKECRAPRK